MKVKILVSLVILMIVAANGAVNKTVDLGGDGTQNMKLNYLDNPGSSLLYLEFVAHLSQGLGYFQTATAICIDKQDDAVDVQTGDNGFGIMFACYTQGGCNDATQLFVWFFASHLSSISPPTWAAGGTDYSHFNTGSLYIGNQTDFDTTYKISLADAASLTIPPDTVDPEWRCYFNFLGDEGQTRLDL